MKTMALGMNGSGGLVGLSVLERGWLSSNNVLLHGSAEEQSVLIDTGHCLHAGQTVALIEHLLQGLPGAAGQLRAIVNTHLHSDHCGGNARLSAHWAGLEIRVPVGEFEAVVAWDEDRLGYRDCGQRIERFAAQTALAPGETLCVGGRSWQALAAPGHDPHALMLFEPEAGVLISGDALWQQGFGVIFPELGRHADGSGFAAAAEVLDRIGCLPVRRVIPGHGSPFTDVAEALQRARERLASFQADPLRHARHAARVLLKYHMLEEQRQALVDLLGWAAQTPLMTALHDRLGAAQSMAGWVCAVVDDLRRSGALHLAEDVVAGQVIVIDGPAAPASPVQPH